MRNLVFHKDRRDITKGGQAATQQRPWGGISVPWALGKSGSTPRALRVVSLFKLTNTCYLHESANWALERLRKTSLASVLGPWNQDVNPGPVECETWVLPSP